MAKEMLMGMGDDHKIVGGMDEGDECFRWMRAMSALEVVLRVLVNEEGLRVGDECLEQHRHK